MRPSEQSGVAVPGSRDRRVRRVTLRPYTPTLAVIVVLLAGLTFVNMAAPYCIKLIVDRVLPGQDREAEWGLIWWILSGLALAYLLRNALFFCSRMLSVRVAEHMAYRLRSDLFVRLQSMRVDAGASEHAGKLSSRVMDDTGRLQQFIEEHLPKMLFNGISFVVLLVVVFVVNWQLAIATVLLCPALPHLPHVQQADASNARAQDHFAERRGTRQTADGHGGREGIHRRAAGEAAFRFVDRRRPPVVPPVAVPARRAEGRGGPADRRRTIVLLGFARGRLSRA